MREANSTAQLPKLYAGRLNILPPGKYVVNNTVNVPSNCVLQGAGSGLTTIERRVEQPPPRSDRGEPGMECDTGEPTLRIAGDNVTIRDLSIVGPANDAAGLWGLRGYESGVIAEGRQRIRIVGCDITNHGLAGVHFANCLESRVERCTLWNLAHSGIYVSGASNGIEISRNHIRKIGPDLENSLILRKFWKDHEYEPNRSSSCHQYSRYGIILTGYKGHWPSDCCVSDNHVEGVSWEGIDTHGGHRLQFLRNTVRNCRVGIHANADSSVNVPCEDIRIAGNFITNESDTQNAGYGIVFGGNKTHLMRGGVITDNQVRGHGGTNAFNPTSEHGAIHIIQSDTLLVSNNHITRFGKYGLRLDGVNRHFLCTGNFIDDSELEGSHSVSLAGEGMGTLIANQYLDALDNPPENAVILNGRKK